MHTILPRILAGMGGGNGGIGGKGGNGGISDIGGKGVNGGSGDEVQCLEENRVTETDEQLTGV